MAIQTQNAPLLLVFLVFVLPPPVLFFRGRANQSGGGGEGGGFPGRRLAREEALRVGRSAQCLLRNCSSRLRVLLLLLILLLRSS